MQHLAAGAPRRGWAADAVRSLLAWAGSVGADPADSSDTALQKRLMVALSRRAAAADVAVERDLFRRRRAVLRRHPRDLYAVHAGQHALFAWTRNLGFYRFTQLLMIWSCRGS